MDRYWAFIQKRAPEESYALEYWEWLCADHQWRAIGDHRVLRFPKAAQAEEFMDAHPEIALGMLQAFIQHPFIGTTTS